MSCFYCVDVHLSICYNKIDDLAEDQKRVLSQAETNTRSAHNRCRSIESEWGLKSVRQCNNDDRRRTCQTIVCYGVMNGANRNKKCASHKLFVLQMIHSCGLTASELYFSYIYIIGGCSREVELVPLYLDIFNDGDFMVECLAKVPLLEKKIVTLFFSGIP